MHPPETAANGQAGAGAGRCAVFADLPPDYRTLAERWGRFGGSGPDVLADLRRRELEAEALVRATARDRARVYGPVTISRGSHARGSWGLMAAAPRRVHPRWQVLLDEAGEVFDRAWDLQEAAEARLRRQWDRNPAGRAAQLLTRLIGRAWVAEDITDAELAACDQELARWRHPSWPCRLDLRRLGEQRERRRGYREFARQVLADLGGGGEPASASVTQPREPLAIFTALTADRLASASSLVRAVPCTAWQEWEWILGLIRDRMPGPELG